MKISAADSTVPLSCSISTSSMDFDMHEEYDFCRATCENRCILRMYLVLMWFLTHLVLYFIPLITDAVSIHTPPSPTDPLN